MSKATSWKAVRTKDVALVVMLGAACGGTPTEALDLSWRGDLFGSQEDLFQDSCTNGLQDGQETDIDCGGSCTPCVEGRRCLQDRDCAQMLCVMNQCRGEPDCNDGHLNGTETDTDCGGQCPPCAVGKACVRNLDCGLRLCLAGQCAMPVARKLSFASSSYPVVGEPRSITTGDFNGDKVLDLCVGIHQTVGTLFGKPNGTFEPVQTTVAGMNIVSVATADFNKDGMDDTVFGDSNGQAAGLLISKNGVLTATSAVPMPGTVGSVAAGDFNGDGWPDVVAGYAGGAAVLANKKNGVLDTPHAIAAAGSVAVSMLPLRGVGSRDVVIGSRGLLQVCPSVVDLSVIKCSADAVPFSSLQSFAAADFDGDGRQDLAELGFGNVYQFSLFQGQPDSTLKLGISVVTDALYGQGIVASDFDRDGFTDLAMATDADGNVEVYSGNGAGGFRVPPTLVPGPGRSAYGLASADFNGDGLPDLAVVYSFQDSVVVFLNTSR